MGLDSNYQDCFLQGCEKSKALSPGELQPPRLRQKTTAAVARRLIGNALSNSGVHDKVSLPCWPSDATRILYIVTAPVYRVTSDCKEAELALTECGLTVWLKLDACSLACTLFCELWAAPVGRPLCYSCGCTQHCLCVWMITAILRCSARLESCS